MIKFMKKRQKKKSKSQSIELYDASLNFVLAVNDFIENYFRSTPFPAHLGATLRNFAPRSSNFGGGSESLRYL